MVTKQVHCRLCGADVHTCKGYLHRVNPKGIDGIWECRPSCTAELTDEQRLLAAIEGEEEA